MSRQLTWKYCAGFLISTKSVSSRCAEEVVCLGQQAVRIKASASDWNWSKLVVPVPVPYGATVFEEPWPPSRQIAIRLFSKPSLASH
jgi:hypothetical protein